MQLGSGRCGWLRRLLERSGHLSGSPLLLVVFIASVGTTVFAQPDQVPRTPSGHLDLQGIWLYQSSTPLQRDEAFADKAVLTPEEAAAYVEERHAAIDRRGAATINADWVDLTGLADNRTSLIIDPPDGRLPARTAAGQHRMDVFNKPPNDRAADGPEDRERLERCIMGRSVPFFAFFFDQKLLIVQTDDHVAIQDEFGELRHIPVNEAARPSQSIRQWGGLSRGHWDGNTLVVETTHCNGKWSFQGAERNMRLVERFTRRGTD